MIPEIFKDEAKVPACSVKVREVQCGDPACAPIDTVVELWFEEHPAKGFGIPAKSEEVTQDDLLAEMPEFPVLRMWGRGEDPEWPAPDPPPCRPSELKLAQGTQVEIRVGDGSWQRGQIVDNWYRDRIWPKWVWVPYWVKLEESGLFTYSPIDSAKRIRPAKVDATSPGGDGAPAKRPRVEEGQGGGGGGEVGEAAESGGGEYHFDDEEYQAAWRFAVGDRVLCFIGEEVEQVGEGQGEELPRPVGCPKGWAPGTVDTLNVPDYPEPSEGDEEGEGESPLYLAPYLVELDPPHNRLTVVPRDWDECIRPFPEAGGPSE